MEQLQQILDKILALLPAEVRDWVANVDPQYWAAGSGGLILLILISALRKRSKKKRFWRAAPQLTMEAFKISPLGRDAFLKIQNNGEKATLTTISFQGRNDIVVKNALAGHLLDKGKGYSILLETNGQKKMDDNFLIELRFMDARNNVYRQTFIPKNNTTRPAKLVLQ